MANAAARIWSNMKILLKDLGAIGPAGETIHAPLIATQAYDSAGLVTNDTWRVGSFSVEGTLNDSDFTMTVPANTERKLESIWVEFTSTATVGNRQLTVELQDTDQDVMGRIEAGAVQAAGATRKYLFGVGLADLTNFRNTAYLTTPLVPWTLLAGTKVRVYDSAAVDAAADDMAVYWNYVQRTV